jgi:hypothetical protein
VPRSSRRASKRPRQLSPRQVRRPRVRQQQLKQPVRLRQQLKQLVRPPQRNLPLKRQHLPVGQPNLLLRPRQLPRFVGFPHCEVFSRDSPGEDFCCTDARTRTLREASCARNSPRENPSGSETHSWRFAIDSCKVDNHWCPWDVRSPFQKRVA